MLAKSTFTSTHHLIVIITFATIVITAVLLGRRWPTATRWGVMGFGLGCWVLSLFYFASFDRLDLAQSLPIQACDILALVAPLSVVLGSRLIKSVTYFGGFGLTTQAFFTPVLQTGPDTLRFWVFWALHFGIVLASIYLIAAQQFRPTWRDWRNAVLFWLVYALTMVFINYQNGWYYGYLGPEVPPSAQDTILQHLGPWPVRPVLMMLLALTIFTLLWLPWPALQRIKKRDQDQAFA
ncbi:MAG: TIGR02206 family membrane protein [Planctomycetota bacterium]